MTNKQIIERHAESVRPRARIELRIVTSLIRELRKVGCVLELDDGDEIVKNLSERQMIDHIFNLDACTVIAIKEGAPHGVIQLTMGNDGFDVISDYSMSIESDIVNTLALAKRIEDRQFVQQTVREVLRGN